MARLLLSTVGSAGDILPLIGPARALRDRGHEIQFALSPDLIAVTRAQGFETVTVGPALRLADDPDMQKMLTMRGGGYVSARHLVHDWLAPSLVPIYHDLRAACDEADALVASSTQLAAGWVAQDAGIPWFTTSVQPLAIPSAYITPPPAFASRRVLTSPGLNRLRWRIAGAQLHRLDRAFAPAADQLRMRPLRDALAGGTLSRSLVVVLSSPHYSPPQPDWPGHVQVTGFTLWGDADPLSPEVTAFLEGHGPPIVVTLGSSASLVADGFLSAAATAAARAGHRCLAIVGHDRNLTGHFPDGTLAVVSAPLEAVLRRASVLIHHGGFGSTAAALSAGLPQIVVPHAFEQAFHGLRIQEMRCGRMLRRWNPARLRHAIDQVLQDEKCASRAREVATLIRGDDGVATAADALDSALTRAA